MGRRGTPEVYTIAPGLPFVDALAAGMLARAGHDPAKLARAIVLLPTRRACQALRDAFLRQRDGEPTLLPRLVPLGEVDEEELALAGAGIVGGDSDGAEAALAPAISPLRRQILLARTVLTAGAGFAPGGRATTPDQAARLAAELGRFLDQVQTERLSFAGLEDLVPDEYARHWQITLRFLTILTEHWPRILADEGTLDAADRRNRLLEAQARAWATRAPDVPVIAAGSTGSIPATADLLEVVAGLPRGCLVLPGLDRSLEADEASALGESHPQFGLARLLDRLGVAPAQVPDWECAAVRAAGIAAGSAARARLIAEAMRPAETTHLWRVLDLDVADAMDGVSRIDCPGAHEEAGVIALVMRQALELPGRTVALVTPDRGLARRVVAEMKRFGVEVDDSAGRALGDSPPGTFLRLCASMVADGVTPLGLLSALKHPLAAGGMERAAFRALVRRLEVGVLRGPRPGAGFAGVRAALDGLEDREETARLKRWLARIEEMARPLVKAMNRPIAPLDELLRAHVALAQALAADAETIGGTRLWEGEAGESANDFVFELSRAAEGFPPFPGRAYPGLMTALMAGRVVRPRHPRHARVHIWGVLEARLQHADVVILGGLNEGIWPPEAVADPWMSRPMRAAFGLPLPERRIGLSAHDFAQGFSAPSVVLTRASRVAGTPTVPSRWLLRLESLLGAHGHGAFAPGESKWLRRQAQLDAPERVAPALAPTPRPPVGSRPRQLSVTRIETWMRDPYAIYARHVLALKPLEPIEADPGGAEYGSFIHQALDAFLAAYPDALPDDALGRLLETGRDAFGTSLAYPGVLAFWWPRFERIAGWFVEVERLRRAAIAGSVTEVTGALILDAPAGPFTVSAKADRIDRLADGSLVIVDYKTGSVPRTEDVALGFAPQLPLEAAVAEAGGFDQVAGAAVVELSIWRLTGGDPAGKEHDVAGDVAALARQAREGLSGLVAAFDDPATPYLCQPRPDKAPRYSDYAHFARVGEWSAGLGEEVE